MANEQNLEPYKFKKGQVDREAAARAGRKGAKAKAEKMREQKTLREYAELLLSLPVSDLRKYNKLARMGIPVEGIDNKMLIVAGLLNEAANGNVQAAKELRNIIGEDAPGAMKERVEIVDDL